MPDETLQIGFTAPEDWFEIDVDRDSADASLRRLVEENLGHIGLDLRAQAEYEATLRFVIGRCQEIGAIAAMGFADVISEAPFLLSAGLILTMVGTGDEEVDAASIRAQLGARGHDLEPITLPIGPAMRSVTRSMELLPVGDESIEVISVKYYVPTDRAIALLAFTTPTVALGAEFIELFDAIAETLEFG